MAFKYSVVSIPKSLSDECHSLLNETAALMEAKTEFEAHCDSFAAIDNVLENLMVSLRVLESSKDPAACIAVLNTDASLESMLGIAEASITKQAACEGLGEALKKAWQTFVGWCRAFWEKVKAFFRRIRNWITGKKQVDEGIKKTVDVVNESNARMKTELLKKIERVKKNLSDAKKELPSDASNETKAALDAWRGAVEDFVKAQLDFIKLADEDPLWLKQATKDQNEKVTRAIAHMSLKKMEFMKLKDKRKAVAVAAPASPPNPPNNSPSSGGAAMPLPPEEDPRVPVLSQKFRGPKAAAVREALAAMKQLANAFPAAFNAQSRGIKEVYQLFVDGDDKYKDASVAAKAIIESMRILAGVFNAAFKKRKGIEIEVGELGAPTFVKSTSDDDDYVEITSLQDLGWKDEDEVVDVCREFSDARSYLMRNVGDAADKFYLDYPEKADDEATNEHVKSIMRLYRLALMVERFGGMICSFAANYISGGLRETLDYVVYLKKRRNVVLKRANVAVAALIG